MAAIIILGIFPWYIEYTYFLFAKYIPFFIEFKDERGSLHNASSSIRM